MQTELYTQKSYRDVEKKLRVKSDVCAEASAAAADCFWGLMHKRQGLWARVRAAMFFLSVFHQSLCGIFSLIFTLFLYITSSELAVRALCSPSYYTLALSLSLCFLWSSPFIFAARAAALIPSWGRNEREKRMREKSEPSASAFLLRTQLYIYVCMYVICVRVLCKSQRAAQWRRCAPCEILKLSDAKCCCLASKEEEEELVLRRFQRISRKSFRSKSAAKSCASRKIFTSALSCSLSLSLATFHLLWLLRAEPFKNTAELWEILSIRQIRRCSTPNLGSLIKASGSLFKEAKT